MLFVGGIILGFVIGITAVGVLFAGAAMFGVAAGLGW